MLLRRRIRWLTIVLVAGALAACSTSDTKAAPPRRSTTTTTTTPRPGDDGALTIGQLAPITGPIASISDSFTVPVKLAVDEMNLAGGVDGKPVGLVVADDGSDSTQARTAAANLLDASHADAIIGPSTSQVALDLLARPLPHPAVICSGSNSYGPISTEAKRRGSYFRTAPPDRLQADALGKLVAADGRRRPVVIAAPDDYGTPFGVETVRSLKARGATAARLEVLRPDDTGAARAVRRALARRPDSVVLIGFPGAIAPVIRQLVARAKGPAQVPTYGSDGLQNAELGALVDPANPAIVAGMKGTTPAGAPAGIDHPFNVRLFTAGVEPFFSASTYDCAILVGLAAVAASSDDPVALREHFAKNLTGKSVCSTFATCSAALGRHRSIHYQGASSKFNRWAGFEPGEGVYDIWSMGLDARPTVSPPAQQLTVP